jgi:hypothetical protein
MKVAGFPFYACLPVSPFVLRLAPTHLGWDTRQQFTRRSRDPPGGRNADRLHCMMVVVMMLTHELFALHDTEFIPEDTLVMYDKLNPVMRVGSLYPNMKEFRLAMRQYAINKEFELGREATNTTWYRGLCHGDQCPWKIHAHVNVKGSLTIIVCLFIFPKLFFDIQICILHPKSLGLP